MQYEIYDNINNCFKCRFKIYMNNICKLIRDLYVYINNQLVLMIVRYVLMENQHHQQNLFFSDRCKMKTCEIDIVQDKTTKDTYNKLGI